MTAGASLTVGIVNYNARDWLPACIESVRRETASLGAEIVLVDNASSDGSVDLVRRDFPGVEVIALSENRGYAAGCNAAFRAGTGRYLLLLNPDVELCPDVLTALLRFVEIRERVGVVGPRLLNSDRSIQRSVTAFPSLVGCLQEALLLPKLVPGFRPVALRHATRFDYAQAQSVEVLLGAFLLCRRSALEELGGMDERFFMYSEEVDLCYRAQRAGWEVWYLPEGEAVHHGGKSTEPAAVKMFVELHRSKVRFFRHHRAAWTVPVVRVLLVLGALVRATVWTGVFLATALFTPDRGRRARDRARPFWHAAASHFRP